VSAPLFDLGIEEHRIEGQRVKVASVARTMNALFLKDLAEKTHRGLRGRVEAGKAGGGLCYGYRVVRTMTGVTVTTGEREIEPAEATIVVSSGSSCPDDRRSRSRRH
jgi:hypothetical protein